MVVGSGKYSIMCARLSHSKTRIRFVESYSRKWLFGTRSFFYSKLLLMVHMKKKQLHARKWSVVACKILQKIKYHWHKHS